MKHKNEKREKAGFSIDALIDHLTGLEDELQRVSALK